MADFFTARRRQKSLPILPEPRNLRSYSVRNKSSFADGSETGLMFEDPEETASPMAGIRGLMRRASVSLKAKASRRHSQTEEEIERPSTSTWQKLRHATSFRNSKILPGTDFHEDPYAYHEFQTPVPGFRNEPPVIPNHGGAAARATAAAQNELYGHARRFIKVEDHQSDRESGIGIPFGNTDNVTAQDMSFVSRVDFATILPSEITEQIMGHLDSRSLAQAEVVSCRWNLLARSPYVWRQVYEREKSSTYATSAPIAPGTGLGMPVLQQPEKDWKQVFKVSQQLENRWRDGIAKPIYLSGHQDSIYCVQFDEYKIITGSRDKTVRVWDLHTYECTLVIGPPSILEPCSGPTYNSAILPDGVETALATAPTVSFPIHHNKSILCLQYDEDILVTGSSDTTCIIHDIKNGYKPIRRLVHHEAAVLDLAFDKKHIITCSKDVSISIWDRESGTWLRKLRGHIGPVNAVQLRGNSIVSCSGDFKVKLWNVDTGKNIRDFEGHTKGLACSQFSEDSRLIASAGNDKIIRIWDANTGECLKQIEAHENLVRSLHIDSVSGRLISGSYDQDIKVFDIESGRLLLDFPKWHTSWVLGAKSDYRRIVSTGQDAKILIMDFGHDLEDVELLESPKPMPSHSERRVEEL